MNRKQKKVARKSTSTEVPSITEPTPGSWEAIAKESAALLTRTRQECVALRAKLDDSAERNNELRTERDDARGEKRELACSILAMRARWEAIYYVRGNELLVANAAIAELQFEEQKVLEIRMAMRGRRSQLDALYSQFIEGDFKVIDLRGFSTLTTKDHYGAYAELKHLRELEYELGVRLDPPLTSENCVELCSAGPVQVKTFDHDRLCSMDVLNANGTPRLS